jgi:hypothetical protein
VGDIECPAARCDEGIVFEEGRSVRREQGAEARGLKGVLDFAVGPADFFHPLTVPAPAVSFAEEPIDVTPGPAPRVVLIAHNQDDAGFLEPHGAAPVTAEASRVIHIEEEVASGAERAVNGARDRSKVGFSRDVIQGVAFAGDKVNGFGKAERPHVGVEDADGSVRGIRFTARDAAHVRRQIDSVDLLRGAGERKRSGSGPAGKVARGFDVRQNLAQDAAACRIDRGANGREKLVVVFREPAIGFRQRSTSAFISSLRSSGLQGAVVWNLPRGHAYTNRTGGS